MTKKEIMENAWRKYHETNVNPFLFPMTFAQCLKASWNAAKYLETIKA